MQTAICPGSFDPITLGHLDVIRRASKMFERVVVCVVANGLRALSDFEYEFMMALTNKKLNSRVETVFLASDERYMYLSSTTVREIASYGGDISRFVPAEILDDLMIKLNGRK